MRYAIVLQRRTDGGYQASVPLMPGIISASSTREEALDLVRGALAEALASVEVVFLDIPEERPAPANLWIETAGLFADDPTLEPMLAGMYAERDRYCWLSACHAPVTR